jgi:hypothetical protein
MADGHKGQALGKLNGCTAYNLILTVLHPGLGRYCEEICIDMAGYCAIEWSKSLHSLTPYEHLARFYRYCFAHFTRNVTGMRGHVTSEVRHAMMSLASAEAIPDLKATLELIRKGGKKATGALKICRYKPAQKHYSD